MDANTNRVYVNPNFNRIPKFPILASNSVYTSNYMHVNPNFTRQLHNGQPNTNFNRKIFVNPSFIKSNNTLDNNQHSDSKLETHFAKNILEDSNYLNNENAGISMSITENLKPISNTLPHPSSKSRYRLVRNTDAKLLVNAHKAKETSTIKISKYKSVPINSFKNNLETVKVGSMIKQKLSCCNMSIPVNKNRSSFKFIRHNIEQTISGPLKLTPKASLLKMKRNIDVSLQIKRKVSNGTRKKNNIPCRLFTKYGKCLRNLSGTCKYLHDKKHVSLCRKFIKGICHDEGCLLSHELSSKKMPTCHFYLKGMCTKSDCPYLHVKLSEKSKICLDFLKGYCDKGDMCSQRHVRPYTDKNRDSKRLSNTSNIMKSNRTVTSNLLKLVENNPSKRLNTQKDQNRVEYQEHANSCKNEEDKGDGDCRYFREDIQNEDVMCEVLKPTRCKLGILPSFIQL